MILTDVRLEPESPSRDRFVRMGARSLGVFPMRSAGQTIGIMSVATRDEARRIEFDDVETLQSLADFVGVALEQRRSAEAVAQSMREARSLADASRALLTRTADRDVLLTQVLDALATHFGREACSLLLVEADRSALVQFGRRGKWWSPGDAVSVIPLDGPGLIALAARTGRVVNVPDVSRDPDYVVGWPEARSELVVPLVLDEHVIGVFDLQAGETGAFTAADARNIAAFAERAALALRLAELVGALRAAHAGPRGRRARDAAPELPPPRAGRPDVRRRGDDARVPSRGRGRRLGRGRGGTPPLRGGRLRRRGHDAPRRRDRAEAGRAPEERGPRVPREPPRVHGRERARRARRGRAGREPGARARGGREPRRARAHGRADPRRRPPPRGPRGHVLQAGRVHARGRRDADSPGRAVRDRAPQRAPHRGAPAEQPPQGRLPREPVARGEDAAHGDRRLGRGRPRLARRGSRRAARPGGDPRAGRHAQPDARGSHRPLADRQLRARAEARARATLGDDRGRARRRRPRRREEGRHDPVSHRARPSRPGRGSGAPQAGRLEPARERRQVLAPGRRRGRDRRAGPRAAGSRSSSPTRGTGSTPSSCRTSSSASGRRRPPRAGGTAASASASRSPARSRRRTAARSRSRARAARRGAGSA